MSIEAPGAGAIERMNVFELHGLFECSFNDYEFHGADASEHF